MTASIDNLTPTRKLITTARGLIAEAFPLEACQLITGAATQRQRFQAIGLFAGTKVTNIVMFTGTLGSGLTLSKVALFDKTGTTELGVSTDQSALFETPNAAGFVVVPLSTPYVVPKSDAYLGSSLFIGTPPTIAVCNNNILIGAALNSVPLLGYVNSQTDMTAPIPAATAYQQGFWFGVS